MIKRYLNILFFTSMLLICIVIVFYSSNKNLIKFDKIKFEGNNFIQSNELFEFINYKLDSSDFYTRHDIDNFLIDIYELNKFDIIDKVSISYSLPDEIIVTIIEKKPEYIIKNKIKNVALDKNGQIISTDFINDDIQNIELQFLVYEIYEELDGDYDIKDLFKNINYNKVNDEYFLNGISILNQLSNYPIKDNIKSISISEHEINLDLNNTKLIFNHNDLESQFIKLDNIINYANLIDTLKIKNFMDLEEINLSFNNQVILKK